MNLRLRIEQIRKFKGFLGSQVWRLFIVSLAAGILMFIVESSFVLVMQGFLRGIGLVQDAQLSLPGWYPDGLTPTVTILLAFGICRGLVYMIKNYIGSVTGQAFSRLQRERTAEYSLLNREQVAIHQVMSVFSERVGQASGVLQSIAQIILVGTSTMMFFLMGLCLAPKELLIGSLILAFLIVPLKKFAKNLNDIGLNIGSDWDETNRLVLQGLRHHFLFKIYGLLDHELEKTKEKLNALEKLFRRYFYILSIKSYFPNIAGIFVICFVTFISIRYFDTPGITLVAFFYLFIRIAQGAGDINSAYANFKLFLPSFKEVYQWHERLKREQGNTVGVQTEPLSSSESLGSDLGITIEARDLSFGYNNDPLLFEKLSFTASRGDVLLIKGESGVGKSTVLMLVIGLLKSRTGDVLINENPIGAVQKHLFEKIAYVGPEPYLIAGTIRENLLFGHYAPSQVSDARMRESLGLAQLVGDRYDLDYFINEHTPMSTGQKQRLSIARSFLREPSVLILDEATANLDGPTEERFIESIRPLLRNITTIIVSHKPSFDRMATEILTLKRPS